MRREVVSCDKCGLVGKPIGVYRLEMRLLNGDETFEKGWVGTKVDLCAPCAKAVKVVLADCSSADSVVPS